MRYPHSIARAVVLLFATATYRPLVAQRDTLSVLGAFVRITHSAACCQNPLVGNVLVADPDSLTIKPQPSGASLVNATIARSSIVSLDVWQRVGAHKAEGATAGAIVGTITGAILGFASGCEHCDGDWRTLSAITR